MTKKLPVLRTSTPGPSPAHAQHELAVRPVATGSRPEFPTRNELLRKMGMLGGATLLATGLAHARPAHRPDDVQEAKQIMELPPPPPPVTPSVDGQALTKKAPSFKVYREGGGIGPPEDMWNPSEVEAFINWTMAREGKLDIKTNYKFEYDGVTFNIDGFDPIKNVGYEYVDKLDYDSDYFTKEVRAKFAAWMKAKQVAILFIEVKRNPSASALRGKVIKFLRDVKRKPPAAGPLVIATPEPPPPQATPTKPAPASKAPPPSKSAPIKKW